MKGYPLNGMQIVYEDRISIVISHSLEEQAPPVRIKTALSVISVAHLDCLSDACQQSPLQWV